MSFPTLTVMSFPMLTVMSFPTLTVMSFPMLTVMSLSCPSARPHAHTDWFGCAVREAILA